MSLIASTITTHVMMMTDCPSQHVNINGSTDHYQHQYTMTAIPTCLVANWEQSEQNDGDNAAWRDNGHPCSRWDDTERRRHQRPG